MNRRGFALIGVLWTIALLATAVGLSVGAARVGSRAARNRMVLTRGRWAAESCLAIASAWWGTPRWLDTNTVDLGRETHCAWRATDHTDRVDVNRASAGLLQRLLEVEGVPAGMAADWIDTVTTIRVRRTFPSLSALPRLPGYDDALARDLTIDGSLTINVNSANRAVLLALPGIGEEAADRLLGTRESDRQIRSLDQLVGLLSQVGQRELSAHYAELSGLVTFAPRQLVVESVGWVGAVFTEPHATIELLVAPLPDRLAVVRRRLS